MLKSNGSQRRPLQGRAFVKGCALAFLVVLALVVMAWPEAATAQSGRRKAAPVSPVPTPTPAPRADEGESESVPRGAEVKRPGVVASFIVIENDNPTAFIDRMAREEVLEAFMRRLGQSSAVEVTPGGKGTRKEARDRAKSESEAHVVLFHLEEEGADRGMQSIGRADSRTLVIRLYVFEPKTGNLKFTDVVYQRPHRESVSIGGVRVPVPGRRAERYPSELQLRQAAHDAADRLMSRFHVILPPER